MNSYVQWIDLHDSISFHIIPYHSTSFHIIPYHSISFHIIPSYPGPVWHELGTWRCLQRTAWNSSSASDGFGAKLLEFHKCHGCQHLSTFVNICEPLMLFILCFICWLCFILAVDVVSCNWGFHQWSMENLKCFGSSSWDGADGKSPFFLP